MNSNFIIRLLSVTLIHMIAGSVSGQNKPVFANQKPKLAVVRFGNSFHSPSEKKSQFDFSSQNEICGEEWSALNSGVTTNLRSVYFLDSNTGYAAGDSSTVLKTTNGGTNWIRQSCDTANLKAVVFVNSSRGFAFGHNGGPIAQAVYSGGVLKGEKGLGGRMFYTNNGGSTWLKVTLPDGVGMINSVHFPTSSTGYAVGDCGVILKTSDGGINWTYIHLPDQMTSAYTGYSFWLKSVFFTDASTGYAVGYEDGFCQSVCTIVYYGMILKTTDGGSNWTVIYSANHYFFNSVFFSNTNVGFAAGRIGLGDSFILKTTDSGSNWDPQTTVTTNYLNSIFMTDPNSGYIAGNGGSVLQTSNGGSTWNLSQPVSGAINLYSVSFPNSNTGYIAGQSGTILKHSSPTEVTTAKSNDKITLFPNPSAGIFKIRIDEPVSNNLKINVYNSSGALVYSDPDQKGKNLIQVDLSQYPSGTYLVRIISGGKVFQYKLIRE